MTLPALTPAADLADTKRQFPNLTEKQEQFVLAYVANGGKRQAAAKAAGYAQASAHVEANRLLQKPDIIQAVVRAAQMALGALAPEAVATIAKLSVRAKSEHVKLAASQDVLDRLGMSAPKRIDLGATLNLSIDLS